jgi:transcriptional regulator with XRE-family HTH domain
MNTDLLVLGKNIRHFRRSLKISQEQLAGRCGLHRSYLSDVERGSRNPSFLTLWAVARGMGLTVSELTRDLATDGAQNIPLTKPDFPLDPANGTDAGNTPALASSVYP